MKDLQYDCDWNIEHYRGCLKSLERLANNNKQQMNGLKGNKSSILNMCLHILQRLSLNLTGRVVVFAQKSGVSLDGHVMLFTGDVHYNWLDVSSLFDLKQ